MANLVEQQKVLLGKAITLKMPNGEERKAQFALVDAANMIASHNEKTFENSVGYPLDEFGDNINDRNYHDDKAAQERVVEYAQNLDADRLIVTSRTPSGSPIIDENGIVVSGNNRTMSLKLAISDYPEQYRNYQNFLIEEASAFGFEKTDRVYSDRLKSYRITFSGASGYNTKTFDFPVLVRIDYDIPALNTLELSKYNKDTKKAERPIDKAIKLGKQLASSERCKTIIGELVGQYETFSDFYANYNDQKRLLDTLISCNILTSQEVPNYFYERGFTEPGKELIENLMAGLVLSKNALIIANETARKFRQIIITSLPVLSANSLLGADSLLNDLNEAIVIEGKMISAKLDFKNWINQINMFDAPPTQNALYMNRLLAMGRNVFKSSIEKYNESIRQNQGADLFGENPTTTEIFQKHIVGKLPETETRLIATFAQPNLENTSNTDSMTSSQEDYNAEMETQMAQSIEKRNATNPFVNGIFFKENPDKILATVSQGVSRWKKPINIYSGSISDVDRIDAPTDFVQFFETEYPTNSVVEIPVELATDNNVEILMNLEKAVETSKKDLISKRTRAKKMEVQKFETIEQLDVNMTLSLREVYEMSNPEISTEELRVYLWYKNKIGRPITNPEWYEIAGKTLTELMSNQYVENWVKNGLVFYFKGELLPAYIYLSGNVYEKYNSLVQSELSENVGTDAKEIIEKYGKDVYDQQVEALNTIFRQKYDARLLIKAAGDASGIKLIATSKFARTFKIDFLVDEQPFKWKLITAGSNNRYGQPDWLATDINYRNTKEIDKLSLTDAFCYWLRTDNSVSIKLGLHKFDIIQYYVFSKQKPKGEAIKDADGNYNAAQQKIKDAEDAAFERLRAKAKSEGDRLFAEFLNGFLTLNDRVRVETEWNMSFNNNVPINTNKVPIAFRMNRYIFGQKADLRAEKREAVAFTSSNGSGLLAYDVGVGKTPSAIFTISSFIDMGYAKRPLVIVPNQTYKQWIAEFKKFCGHIRVNDLYNLNKTIVEDWQDVNGETQLIEEGSVTIITYQGMENLGFNETTAGNMHAELTQILMQDTSGLSDKKAEKEALRNNTKAAGMVGKALARTTVNIEDFGFDYVCLDEAHAAKKVFTNVAGEAQENTGTSGDKGRAVVAYKISAGIPSATAIKAFSICQYVQKNYGGNTQLLTATPFTNSPLEIFSMLAMIGYGKLEKMGLNNLNTFFDTFIEVSYELVINAKLNPERKQIIKGFNNLIVLQQLVRQFILYKTGEEVKVPRPNKYVLPMKNKVVDGVLTVLPIAEQVDCVLPLSEKQAYYMDRIKAYAEGTIEEAELCSGSSIDEDIEEDALTSEGQEMNEEVLDSDEKAGVRMLKAMNHMRNLVLSPFLFDCAGMGSPTYKSYVETSNKIFYTCLTIKAMKEYHEANGTPISGSVIYMERGVQYFQMIKKYLVEEVGFKPEEIGIITSQIKEPSPAKMKDEDKKEYVKNLFLGKEFNAATMELERVPDEKRIKVLIGSATIREGINLQEYSATLFNLFLPWNPTDNQQLGGRIWRQGNLFANVRIVNPLMVDSIDIFMFQKLEEKTARINSVWETDGVTNALKTEEFDPAELKYALIKNPRVLAQMILIEDREKIDEEIADVRNIIKRHEQIKEYQAEINSHETDLREFVVIYRPNDANKDLPDLIRVTQNILKTQTDKNGLPMQYTHSYRDPKVQYSPLTPAYKPYYFDRLALAVRNLKRIEREYLVPNELTVEMLPGKTIELEARIEQMKTNANDLMAEANIQNKAEEIIRFRAENNIREKSLEQLISEFSRLNYLLDDVKDLYPKPAGQTCPPVDEKGIVRIDPEGLLLLEDCNSKQPQTKRLHEEKDAEGVVIGYTESRKELHRKIIESMTKNAVCIGQDQPIAVLMGGAPGSGKSTFLKKNAPFLTSDLIWKIDADEVRSQLPEYKGWNAPATHEEARDIVDQLLTTYDESCKHDILYDGTMSNAKKYIPLIRKLKQQGYKVFIAYMEVPKEISIQRALARYQNNNGSATEYGRYVPMHVIDDFFRTGAEGYENIKNAVDGYIKMDSQTQTILERGGMDIPKDRPYSIAFEETDNKDPFKLVEEVKVAEPTKAELKAALAGAKAIVSYLEKFEKTAMKEYIAGLQILIKYS